MYGAALPPGVRRFAFLGAVVSGKRGQPTKYHDDHERMLEDVRHMILVNRKVAAEIARQPLPPRNDPDWFWAMMLVHTKACAEVNHELGIHFDERQGR